jgi:NAD(P)-dependent dehydrogenase (short-subunit alcohol dehydrogenase family)
MRFSGKTAVVLGGNSGIGLATAKKFAEQGAKVAITGRNRKTLDAAKAETGAALAAACDIADLAAMDGLYTEIKAALGRIDMLVVNAGVGGFAPAREVTPEFWDQTHGINLRGAFFAAQKALPLMGEGGSIVFTGSIGSVLALPGNCVYASAKAGLRAIARNLAVELVAEKIRVNIVSPGPTDTPIIDRSGLTPEGVEGMRKMMTEAVPMKRMGTPEEIADAILFLSSSEASFITGVDLYADGGCVEIR